MMDDGTLKALLQEERSNALGVNAANLADERARALDYYLGDMGEDMPSQDGRSSAVSSDVSDTVEGMLPGLMDVFAGSDEVIRFEPVGPEDEAAAEQETDYVNHVFMQKNPGFLVLYTFIKDALLSKNGIVKIHWEETEKEERETYHDQPDDVFAMLAAQPDAEVLEHSEHKDEQGNVLHDVTLVKRRSYGCAKVSNVPPEEFGITRRARSIRDATYCYHEPANRTEADLIAQGYDADQVKGLPSVGISSEIETAARDTVDETAQGSVTDTHGSRPVRLTEHYAMLDMDETGKPALHRITTGGDEYEVLTRDGKPDIVRVDEMPFAAMTPVIMTHRFFGRSIADLVMDIQRIKTALLRATLDNSYLLNNQRIEIAESHVHERTLDDLLVNRPGGIVRTKMPGGLNPIVNQPIGNSLFPVIEYMDATREWRTGVTRQGQGIDANSLQNQSATAVAQIHNAAQARIKLIARIFAETGIRDMFSLLHGCIRKNDRQVNTVRLRNKWVPVDPRNWKSREDMTINVGLGSGSRQQEVQHLMMILGLQKEGIAVPQLGLVKPKNMYNSLTKLIERVGHKSVEAYFSDPDQNQQQPQEPLPDPKMIEAQGKVQVAQEKAKADIQVTQAKTQAQAQQDMASTSAEMQLKREQMMAEIQLKREQMATEAQLKREQMLLEADMKKAAGYYSPKLENIQMGGEVG